MENQIVEPSIKINLANKFWKRCCHMMNIEPIIGNIIAIIFAMGILALLCHPSLFPIKIGKYYHYMTFAIYGAIILQSIKSATRSLFIPLIILAIASFGFAVLNINPDFHLLSIEALKELMLLGVISLAISIFFIN